MNAFHFLRMTDDGRLTSPISPAFATIEEAKAAAPDLLLRLRMRTGKVVLVQILEEAKVTATVAYDKWPAATRKKHGVS